MRTAARMELMIFKRGDSVANSRCGRAIAHFPADFHAHIGIVGLVHSKYRLECPERGRHPDALRTVPSPLLREEDSAEESLSRPKLTRSLPSARFIARRAYA